MSWPTVLMSTKSLLAVVIFLMAYGDCWSSDENAIVTPALTTHEKGFGPGRQDWGFVEVRKGAFKFWWLYLTTANLTFEEPTARPLAIWLQGGPGASSTGFGNFEELGPLDLDLRARNYTWVKDMNVLFIDSPVGSGFSYVEEDNLLTTDNAQIANDLVQLMRGFYSVHPEFESVPLHIFAESYGGKVAVEFAYVLEKAIKSNTINSNLKSVTSIDGWISPIDSVLSWAPFLLHLGLVNPVGHDTIMTFANETQRLLNNGMFEAATAYWSKTESVISQEAGSVDFYNVLTPIIYSGLKLHNLSETSGEQNFLSTADSDEYNLSGQNPYDRDQQLSDLMNGPVRKALNISDHIQWGGQSSNTFKRLSADFMKPSTDYVELLLNETIVDVNIITGQLDLIVATPGTVKWVQHIRWPEYDNYWNAKRNVLHTNGIIEGFAQVHDHFGMFWVNRAGHMVPLDNPKGMDTILRRVTKYDADK